MRPGRPMRRAMRWAAVAGLVGGLAACGNDTDGLQTVKMVRVAGSSLVGMARPAPPPAAEAATPEAQAAATAQAAAAALKAVSGPAILATIETMGGAMPLGMVGDSNGVRTYATAAQQQLMLRGGLLAGTRGLGHDLMSSDTAAVGALIRGQRAGTAPRVQRYLDGEWRERPLNLTCQVAPKGTISAGGVSGMQMAETCTGGGVTIQNSYVVSGGTILGSRQWVGPQIGHVSIQVLRP